MNKIMINKSLRSIWRNKKSYFSGIFVLAIGLSLFIGMYSGYLLYHESVRLYHIETNFADAFASVRAMPESSVDRLTRIEGVVQSQGILNSSVNARLDGVDDLIGVLLVGIDTNREMVINRFIYTGEPITANNDIWVSEQFNIAHNLDIGDTIRLIINGRYENFTIRGTVLSPEYLFTPVVGGGIADPALNTVGFVQRSVAEVTSGMQGMVNNISFILDEAVSFQDVEPYLYAALERYGVVNIISRENHGSYIGIMSQAVMLSMMGTLFPAIFLSIAVGMLYITLRRLITLERTEIGTLKAIGFSTRYIISGYLLQGVLAATVSFVFAIGLGWIIGGSFYGLIAEFFDLKWLPFALNGSVLVIGFFISIATGLFGVVMGAKSSMRVQPAEAMREAPPSAKSVGGKLDGWFSRLVLDTGGKLAIRSMQRNAKRVFITVASIAAVFAFMNINSTMNEQISAFSDDMFNKIQTSDATIILNSFEPRNALLRDIGQMRGVPEAEAVLTMVADLENNGITRTLAINGLDAKANLFNIFDNDGNQIRTNSGGLILSRFFTDELGLELGQKVSVDNSSFRAPVYVEITQIIEASIGLGAYMEITELSMLFGSETVANMVMINVEEGYLPAIFDELAYAGNIAALNDNERAFAMARENADLNAAIFGIINTVAAIICFAIIYNLSSIALGEKQREYATLRVLGFQAPAVTEINTFEYVLMLFAGSIVGIGISYLFIPLIGSMFSFEQSILDVRLSLMPTIITFAACALAVAVSCFLTGRQIKKFNLVDVLKER